MIGYLTIHYKVVNKNLAIDDELKSKIRCLQFIVTLLVYIPLCNSKWCHGHGTPTLSIRVLETTNHSSVGKRIAWME